MQKLQYTNNKSQTIHNNQMTKTANNRIYDLEERTLAFAKGVILICEKISKTTINIELLRQLIRAGTSVGANYREANEALSRKDFVHRMKITRKETKEATYWLELVEAANPGCEEDIRCLAQESRELRSIFTSIIDKSH